jgi:hypothetical protein
VSFAHGEITVIGTFPALLLLRLVGIDPMVAVPTVANRNPTSALTKGRPRGLSGVSVGPGRFGAGASNIA